MCTPNPMLAVEQSHHILNHLQVGWTWFGWFVLI
jgi:hypothetical protein